MYVYLYSQLLYPSIHQCIVRSFPNIALNIINNFDMNMGVQISFELMFLFPLDVFLEVKLLNQMVVTFLIFWGPPHYFVSGTCFPQVRNILLLAPSVSFSGIKSFFNSLLAFIVCKFLFLSFHTKDSTKPGSFVHPKMDNNGQLWWPHNHQEMNREYGGNIPVSIIGEF